MGTTRTWRGSSPAGGVEALEEHQEPRSVGRGSEQARAEESQVQQTPLRGRDAFFRFVVREGLREVEIIETVAHDLSLAPPVGT
jgi:hypothetical protein